LEVPFHQPIPAHACAATVRKSECLCSLMSRPILAVASSVLTIGRFADGIMVKKWLNRRFLSEYQTDNVLGFGEDAALCGSSSWGCDRCPEYLTAEFTS
jgi:hypothetical protein